MVLEKTVDRSVIFCDLDHEGDVVVPQGFFHPPEHRKFGAFDVDLDERRSRQPRFSQSGIN